MTRPFRWCLASVIACALLAPDASGSGRSAPPDPDGDPPSVEYHQSMLVDPAGFFGVLVERYRRLVAYEDQVHLIQTMHTVGGTPHETDQIVVCRIDDQGRLDVRTAARQAREGLALNGRLKTSEQLDDLRRRYDLWLAPHMVLKYADQPLRDFREGVIDGFTATEASEVTVGEKPMVHVTLRSNDEADENEAEFELYVNPESMLIERIEGEQRLPDGASLRTTIEISPTLESTADETPAETPSETPTPARPAEATTTERNAPASGDVPAVPARGLLGRGACG